MNEINVGDTVYVLALEEMDPVIREVFDEQIDIESLMREALGTHQVVRKTQGKRIYFEKYNGLFFRREVLTKREEDHRKGIVLPFVQNIA